MFGRKKIRQLELEIKDLRAQLMAKLEMAAHSSAESVAKDHLIATLKEQLQIEMNRSNTLQQQFILNNTASMAKSVEQFNQLFEEDPDVVSQIYKENGLTSPGELD